MKKNTVLLIVLGFFLTSAHSRELCFSDAFITRLTVGYVGDSYSECPDKGNCVRFDYTIGTVTKTSFLQEEMNLNDGQKGMALYDMLKTAMILGYRVTGWSDRNSCSGYYPQVDGLSMR